VAALGISRKHRYVDHIDSGPIEIAWFGHSGSLTSQLCPNVLLLMAWRANWTLRVAKIRNFCATQPQLENVELGEYCTTVRQTKKL
jgi:hypothetical protein